ncbi:MAG: nitroreductase family protein [Phycisphaerales bacterium]
MPDSSSHSPSRLDSMGLPPELPQVPHDWYRPDGTSEEAARRYFEVMDRRRSVRFFSDKPVSRATIEWLVRTGGTAPSGAHKQPWRFVCVNDAGLKKEIRAAAEAEEREFYERRATEKWLADLAPLGTDSNKPFLEIAPWLIIVFQLAKTDDGGMVYYREESVGIATGMLISAIHHAGLVTLTHTPSPMKFLSQVLGRPDHERPFLLLPVGYPADDATVPQLARKPLEEIMVVNRGDAGEDGTR